MMNKELKTLDPEIYEAIKAEKLRQEHSIELIASENFVSKAVLAAQGSIMTNKYAEGYAGKRYYCGCEEVDKAEVLAIERLKQLFKCSYANVQPHSGSQANQAVYLALLQPGDKILGMSLDCGGHLTHGAAPNLSGKWFKPLFYGVDPKTYLIDYSEVERLALEHKPKLIIAGYSAYTQTLDFAKFRAIADKVGAYLMADIAHIAGIVATGRHPSPFPHAHIVTSTTHKTLRGPRGGVIMSNDDEIGQKLNKAVFPGLQGGPLMHIIAAKAVAFKEALTNDYKSYIDQVLLNATALGKTLVQRGYDILTGGTVNHIVLLDLRKDGLTGKLASEALDRAGITSNKNTVPFDSTSPFITSGVRLGTPACTTRGFKEKEFIVVGNLIADVLDSLKQSENNSKTEQEVYTKVIELTKTFPIYD
ncbi:Serine hydroxymethyltransferase [Candidatus Megaera venefica]|uniref:Serine hydroxymethyltransferase n=1 Tax=Candidatus Megaera venefica TaxID=2055910 RepID=A0ABU5NDW5_9RICK|nr:serine hydroxymethyltransferase [Candidatus Megaera venefica]MEA0971367.1 Serine hydroxymethyltransferase [Candidatus Megaera venefica]